MSIQRYEPSICEQDCERFAEMVKSDVGRFVKFEEIERYQKALEALVENEWGICEGYRGNEEVIDVFDEETCETLGKGATPLEAIENAMKEAE